MPALVSAWSPGRATSSWHGDGLRGTQLTPLPATGDVPAVRASGTPSR
jgi:hypothetical protein